jgi:hypothetical protein
LAFGNELKHANAMRLNRTQWAAALAVGVAVALQAAHGRAPKVHAGNQPAAHSANAPVSPAAIAEYRRLLAIYNQVHGAYVAAASAYWSSIAAKRKVRFARRARNESLTIDDYVLTQPPVYTGPPKPADPSKPKAKTPPPPPVPVVEDFHSASMQEFKFTPRRPENELEFKRAYAEAAAAAGLTRNQAVRVYAFEATGNGAYDVQAGLEYSRPGARAITTALGYNQLLATNSVELMAESGNKFVAILEAKAKGLPEGKRAALESTIAVLRKMIAFARGVPDAWGRHELLAKTRKGLAIHAMNLDLDVGPLLQTEKLLDSVVYARRKGYAATLTAAELEMMNLTGDGNGFDMVMMPSKWRKQVPTANFFQRSGYGDNPVAQRNNTVATLIAATDTVMDKESEKRGAKDLATVFPN